ncbi:MAG: hypothetical protein WEB06_03040 [Actinomycetota bacterium]
MKALLLCLVTMLTTASLAWSADIATPDGRVRVEAGAKPSEGGASATLTGRAGAFGFTNTASLGLDGARVGNPPTSGAVELSRSGFSLELDESPYGPPIATATLGVGGITEAVDDAGRMTGLIWPGPGWYDQVNFLQIARGHPNRGAPANGGSFGGIGTDWLTPEFGWLPVSQTWGSEDSETLVTVLAKDGATVRITDVVHPTLDLVARNFAFSGTAATFSYYANMNPTTTRVPRVPSVTDALLDNVSDFATAFDPDSSVMFHFRPYRVDPVPLTTIVTSHKGETLVPDALDRTYGRGVYVAIGASGPATEHQAGIDAAGLVREEAEGTALLDPYHDLSDGHLSGSDFATGKTAGGLAGIPPDPDGSYTIYISASDTASGAAASVAAARASGFGAIREASESWWSNWLAPARLPATSNPRALAVSKQALKLIRTATDRRTGAIVANATPQTPYRQDWVRDGAFFNYALLLAGYDELAKRHGEFYARIYRPGGTWDSFYYPDGGEAGAVFPYEIDSQGLALWALWLPYEFTGDRSYLERVYPAIADTANALLLCHDPLTNLQCYAPEDDALQPTQGTQGAATTYLALSKAVAAAEALGVEPDPRWGRRAAGLREAAIARLCDVGGCGGGRGGVYLAWPSRLLSDGAPQLLQTHLAGFASELDARANFSSPEIGGYFQYPMESLLALAPLWTAADREDRLTGWVAWLADSVAHPGVLQFGERIFRTGDRTYLHSIGFPHIWSGAEAFIGAAFVHGLSGCPAGLLVGEATCRG